MTLLKYYCKGHFIWVLFRLDLDNNRYLRRDITAMGVGALQLWAGGGCQAVPKAKYGIRQCGTVRERVPLGHGLWDERVL